MKEKLEKIFKEMSPKGSLAWFYREFVKGNVENVSPAYFEMMVSGTRTMRPDVKEIIDNFLNTRNGN
jgi:hypothetical protein